MCTKLVYLVSVAVVLYLAGAVSAEDLFVPEGTVMTKSATESYGKFFIQGTLIVESTGHLSFSDESTLHGRQIGDVRAEIIMNGGSITVNNRVNLSQSLDAYVTMNSGTFTVTGTCKFPDEGGGTNRIWLYGGTMHSHDIEFRGDRNAIMYVGGGKLQLDTVGSGGVGDYLDPTWWRDEGWLLPAEGYDEIIIQNVGPYTEIRGVGYPKMQFESASSGALESVSPVNLTVNLEHPEAGGTYTVQYARTGGTATPGSDFTLTPGTLTFNPGDTSKTIPITIVDDGPGEEDETIIVTLSNPTGPGVVPGNITEHTYTIIDPRPTVQFDADSSKTTEDASPHDVVVTLDRTWADPVTVYYTVSGGTATQGVDYTLPPSPLVFAAGEMSKPISIELVDDGEKEDPETIILALTSATNAKLGAILDHTCTVRDPWAKQSFEIFRVDMGCPGNPATLKDAWTQWEVANGCDGDRHDGRGISNIEETGINAYICDEGDGGSGNLLTGGGDPICNTRYEYYSGVNENVSIELRFSGPGLTEGEYWVYTYHNAAGKTPMTSITATGPNVVQVEEVLDVPIQNVTSDDDLVPSLIKFYTDGSGTVTITYHNGLGSNAVVNAFSLHSTVAPTSASNPNPAKGESNVSPDAVLSWTPGFSAASHDVYLGTDFNDVNEATTASPEYKDSLAADVNWYDPPDLLDFGTTYYWRIDEANDPDIWKGKVWHFITDSGKARDPIPDNGGYALTDTTLNWTPGALATSHNVFFGTDFDDVNDATTSSDEFMGSEAVATYSPGLLEEGGIYFWRIDEVGATTYVKGDTWGFTATGRINLRVDFALPQWADPNLVVAGSEKPGWWHWVSGRWADMYSHDFVWEDGGGAKPTDSGIADSGVHAVMTCGYEGQGGLHVRDMCRGSLAGDVAPFGSPMGDPIANSWYYAVDWAGQDLGDIILIFTDLPAGEYELYSYHNHWEPCTQETRNCMRCVCEDPHMPPMPSITANPLPPSTPPGYRALPIYGTGKGVTAIENAYDVQPQHVFLDDELIPSYIRFITDGSPVMILYEAGGNWYPDCARSGREGSRAILNAFHLILIDEVLTAFEPNPANRATDVPPSVALSWSPGNRATSHDVYFGTSLSDVRDANTSTSDIYVGRQPNCEYEPPGLLELGKTFFWRIDEVNDPNNDIWKGYVWSFTVTPYIVVDDMETYDDTDNIIYDTWVDGLENGTGSVIDLGIDPCHGGEQSMQFQYDNNDVFGSEKYSETCRTFSDPCDWTVLGMKALTLYFYGNPDNDANPTEQMYIGLEDSTGAGSYAEVRYGDNGEDMNDIKDQEWQEWNINLEDFNDGGVILTDVNTIYIGFGDRDDPVAGGSGAVYFDDIRLYARRCIPPGPYADLNGDCIVDHKDLKTMANEWLNIGVMADLYVDDRVNLKDYAILAESWLKEEGMWP